jgi:UDP-N-acetylglucosamine 3-dehydrogenase
MFKSTQKIALIGCGAIAEQYYLPALIKHHHVLENLILVDRDKTRAEGLASQFKVKNHLVDYREVLKEVDGAIIALPIELHHPISMEFLSRSVHVLCEKPLAESEENAREMVEQAQKRGVFLAVDYFQRLIPSFAKVKQLLAEKVLGEPLEIKYFVGEKFDWPTVSGFYFKSKASARGDLRDRGSHVIDHICWWLGGKPSLISSQNDSFGGSDAVAHVEFKFNRCRGEVKLSWLSKFPCRFTVNCEAGKIEGDVYDYKNVILTSKSGKKKRLKLDSVNKSAIGLRIVTNFINVLRNLEKPLISGSDVLDSIQFIDECYQAATRFEIPWYEVLEVESGP